MSNYRRNGKHVTVGVDRRNVRCGRALTKEEQKALRERLKKLGISLTAYRWWD